VTGVPDAVASALPGGYTLLGPRGVLLVRWALKAAEASARRDGIDAPQDFILLRETVHAAAEDARSAIGSAEARLVPGLPLSPLSTPVLVDPVGTAEAARLLHWSAEWVRSRCRAGEFETARRPTGGSWVIERDEVESRALAQAERVAG